MVAAVHDAPTLARVHEELLLPSFPPEERGSLEELLAGVASGTAQVWVQDAPGQDLAGTAVVTTWPEAAHAVLLAWLAVRGTGRSRGVGSALLHHVLHEMGDRMLLAEIEPADRPAGDPAHGDPRARVAFYHRHGARRLALPYWQPATGPGHEPVQLDLVVVPPPGGTVPDRVVAAPVRSLMEAYALRDLPEHLAGPLAQACRGPQIRTEPLVSSR